MKHLELISCRSWTDARRSLMRRRWQVSGRRCCYHWTMNPSWIKFQLTYFCPKPKCSEVYPKSKCPLLRGCGLEYRLIWLKGAAFFFRCMCHEIDFKKLPVKMWIPSYFLTRKIQYDLAINSVFHIHISLRNDTTDVNAAVENLGLWSLYFAPTERETMKVCAFVFWAIFAVLKGWRPKK